MRLLAASLRAGTLFGFLLASSPLAAAEAGPPPFATALERAGLSNVRALSGDAFTGRLEGATQREIVLSAHCGDTTVACDVVLAALADLARTPLQHRLVVVMLREGGEVPLPADFGLGPADRVLAHLHVGRLGRHSGPGPLIQILPDRERGPEAVTPGWIVHALLRAGEAAGQPLRVADRSFPGLAQLVLRAARPRAPADAAPEWGIPAAALAEGTLLPLRFPELRQTPAVPAIDRWSAVLATAVRRLDRLEGRPIPEDRYLAVFGRVWLRRDLCWLGLIVWGLLVFRAGRAGRRAPASRRAAWQSPSFLFRALLLGAIFLATVFSILLLPAAVLAFLVPAREDRGRILRIGLALLPSALFLAALGLALGSGVVDGLRPLGLAALLVPTTLGAFLWMVFGGIPWRSRPPA